jgi:hypothetical protein
MSEIHAPSTLSQRREAQTDPAPLRNQDSQGHLPRSSTLLLSSTSSSNSNTPLNNSITTNSLDMTSLYLLNEMRDPIP